MSPTPWIHARKRHPQARLSVLLAGALLLFAPLLVSSAPAPAAAGKSRPRPNVIFILADDLGIVDINAYAQRFTGARAEQMYYETPQLDRLVRGGVSFSQAYACQLCSPTRTSLLTGKNAARIGMTTAVGGNVRTFYNQGIAPPEGYVAQDALEWVDKISIQQALLNGTTIDALPSGQPADQGRDELTIAEAMTEHRSAFIGKWHVGGHGSRGWQPRDQGFEEISYFDEGGSPYFKWRALWNNRALLFPTMPQPELLRGRTGPDLGADYLTDELTEHALAYLRARAEEQRSGSAGGKPFFLYLCHFAVHTPFQGRQADLDHFGKKATRGWNGHDNPVYAAMLRSLDASVGRLLDALEATGLEENTLVVFMSDNGGVTYTSPVATCNAPFKGGKALHFEGGIRVPLVFRWKGRIEGGRWSDVPVDCADLFPTLLEFAGYDPRPHYRQGGIDGRSIVSLFEDPTNARGGYSRDTHFWHYPLNVIVKNPEDGQPSAPSSAVRQGDWKLIFDWSGALRLYNIARDPFEKEELSEKQPQKALELFRLLNDWLDANVAPKYLPALNPNYDPSKEARNRPFVDLRRKHLGEARAIRAAASDPRFAILEQSPGSQPKSQSQNQVRPKSQP